MNFRKGDEVIIKPKEWFDARVGFYNLTPSLVRLINSAGKLARITEVKSGGIYDIYVSGESIHDIKAVCFEPQEEEYIEAKEAVVRLAHGDILYDGKYFIGFKDGVFVSSSTEDFSLSSIYTGEFNNLQKRYAVKERFLTCDEALAWSNSKGARYYLVGIEENGIVKDWNLPELYNYAYDIKSYRRKRFKPDFNGFEEIEKFILLE